MKKFIKLLFLCIFVLSIQSCRPKVDGTYTVTSKFDYLHCNLFLCEDKEIVYLLSCIDDKGEYRIYFRVSRYFYDEVEKGTVLVVNGRFPTNMRNGTYWHDLRTYGY